jgi:hypothetical protein
MMKCNCQVAVVLFLAFLGANPGFSQSNNDILIGQYNLPPTTLISIYSENGSLLIESTTQKKTPLIHVGGLQYRYGDEGRVIFRIDSNTGKANSILHYNQGVTATAIRIVDGRAGQTLSGRHPKYVNTYVLDKNTTYDITEEDGQLFSQPTGQEKVPLFRVENSFYVFDDVSYQFRRTESDYYELILTRDDKSYVLLNLAEFRVREESKQNLTEISLSDEELSEYVGDYKIIGNANISISKDGEQLFSQVTGRQRRPIYPREDLVFIYKEINGNITFNRNNSGQIVSLELKTDGNTISGDRVGVEHNKSMSVVSLNNDAKSAMLGDFEIDSDTNIKVRSNSDGIIVDYFDSRFPKVSFDVFPGSDSTLFAKDIDAVLTFQRCNEQKLDCLTFKLRGSTQKAVRLDSVSDKMWKALADGRVGDLKKLLDQSADPTIIDFRYETFYLNYAAALNNVDAMKILIKHGANIDALSEDWYTALHTAAYYGAGDAARFLCDLGADTSLKNNNRMTPLQVAQMRENLNVAKIIEKATQ